MSKILGSDITVGTRLLWHKEFGVYYKETREVIRTVARIVVEPDYPHADAFMYFENDAPNRGWFINFDKEYTLADEYENRFWLDGDPNNPL